MLRQKDEGVIMVCRVRESNWTLSVAVISLT